MANMKRSVDIDVTPRLRTPWWMKLAFALWALWGIGVMVFLLWLAYLAAMWLKANT